MFRLPELPWDRPPFRHGAEAAPAPRGTPALTLLPHAATLQTLEGNSAAQKQPGGAETPARLSDRQRAAWPRELTGRERGATGQLRSAPLCATQPRAPQRRYLRPRPAAMPPPRGRRGRPPPSSPRRAGSCLLREGAAVPAARGCGSRPSARLAPWRRGRAWEVPPPPPRGPGRRPREPRWCESAERGVCSPEPLLHFILTPPTPSGRGRGLPASHRRGVSNPGAAGEPPGPGLNCIGRLPAIAGGN